MGTLAIIATPIGNLEDITYRAVRILGEADMILCEDTRTTRKLLERYQITGKKLVSYHTHSALGKIDFVIEALREGKQIALVSDAGTPCISDPGMLLVSKVRETLIAEVQIVAIPGPSALISALSISGLSVAPFIFWGFIPHKKGRETLFKTIAADSRVQVCYESSHRVLKTLTALEKVLSAGRRVLLARELTKIHEEVLSGTAGELAEILTENPVKQKGEFVLIISNE
jgi:16S rRNA (cytidine1402-2'-O)-methyltransferase